MLCSQRGWQLIAESKIRTAIEAGDFDDLPGFGKPLHLELDCHDDHWWIKAKAKRERLNLLPPALQLKRQTERRVAAIEQLTQEFEVRAELADLNKSIRQSNLQIYWGPPSDVIEIDIEQFVVRWKQRMATR